MSLSTAGAMAERCISLQGSTTCPSFQSASISTDSTLVGFLCVSHEFLVRMKHCVLTSCYSSFLQFVSDRASFDAQLESYVQTTYVQDKSVYYAL